MTNWLMDGYIPQYSFVSPQTTWTAYYLEKRKQDIPPPPPPHSFSLYQFHLEITA